MRSLKKHGKKLLIGAGVLAATFASAPHSAKIVKCVGDERWKVKTLQDESASEINFTPEDISFSNILKMERSDEWSTNSSGPRLQDELQVYSVKGTIDYVKVEDDGDIHIELVDIRNKEKTLVAEIPNPECAITKKSEYKDLFRKARNKFITKYQDKSVYSKGVFEITGVLFHDKRNHGKGGNEEGVELHPVVDLKKIK